MSVLEHNLKQTKPTPRNTWQKITRIAQKAGDYLSSIQQSIIKRFGGFEHGR